jgi:hypothetical protein
MGGMRLTVAIGLSVLVLARAASAQSTAPSPPEESKRIWGIIPNYRTSPDLTDYTPLTSAQKFDIAKQDMFDRGTFALALIFGAQAQLAESSPSYGHGFSAYARYATASYADWAVGDLMTEGVYPALLHEDPRYFRRGEGGVWSRLGYAVKQIVWTHTDSGGSRFNLSEVLGNSTAVAISNLYYPDNRSFGSNAGKVGLQIGVDMASNILKEFSPDLDRAVSRKRHSSKP